MTPLSTTPKWSPHTTYTLGRSCWTACRYTGIIGLYNASFPTPVGTPGGKPQRLTASAKKGRERPYSHSLVLPAGASQTPFPQKAKKDCSTHAALFVFTVRVPVHPPGGAATQQIAPPTRAPAGRGPTDARHSRRARARAHHGHREATKTPQLQRLLFTEKEDQPRAARRAEDEAGVLLL